MIYDYLFFKSYQLAKRSKNFEDTPVLGGIWGVMLGFMFNIFTIVFVSDKFFRDSIGDSSLFVKGRYVFSVIIVASLWFYFKHNKRWQKIITKYEEKEKRGRICFHPIIVLVVYYLLSAALLFLTGMYKNGDGVFK